MSIKFTDCNFEGNGTGIKAPESVEMELTGTVFKNNGKAIDIFVPEHKLLELGLPENTPQDLLQEVIQILKQNNAKSDDEKMESILDSNLFKWLGHGASIASIGSALIGFVQTL
jgi:hypothetical protein